MYRTGDLARWRGDGRLEYLGRADDQARLRGFRIEPGEISSVLAAHPGVRGAAVLVREDRARRPAVGGLVVPADGAALPRPPTCGAHAAGRLPDHMVPSAFVVLDALPLTPNGKLDWRALPVPDTAAAVSSRQPRDPGEESLCAIFAKVLELPGVGIDDSFFDSGRALPARDEARQPGPRGTGRRTAHPRRVRGTHGGRAERARHRCEEKRVRPALRPMPRSGE